LPRKRTTKADYIAAMRAEAASRLRALRRGRQRHAEYVPSEREVIESQERWRDTRREL
jgi:hypothetical protein